MEDLRMKTMLFSDIERCVYSSWQDENSGRTYRFCWPRGFVDLGDTTINYATLSNVQELATHVFVFLIKSIVNPLSYTFATFCTTGATSFHIFTLFWKAVNYLERIDL